MQKAITSPIKAIRAMCIQCNGGDITKKGDKRDLIEGCQPDECALHPFRFGKNPFHTRASTKTQERSKS
jgi:hypothetical protein